MTKTHARCNGELRWHIPHGILSYPHVPKRASLIGHVQLTHIRNVCSYTTRAAGASCSFHYVSFLQFSCFEKHLAFISHTLHAPHFPTFIMRPPREENEYIKRERDRRVLEGAKIKESLPENPKTLSICT